MHPAHAASLSSIGPGTRHAQHAGRDCTDHHAGRDCTDHHAGRDCTDHHAGRDCAVKNAVEFNFYKLPGVVRRSGMQYILYSTLLYTTEVYSTVMCSTVLYCAVMYSRVFYCQISKPTTGLSHATKYSG